MGQFDLEQMSLDHLWELHVKVSDVLKDKTEQERQRLVEQLRYLQGAVYRGRPYPQVLPKYRNPDYPAETWTGRGKRPRWLRARLDSGARMDDFRT
jgi:DNA-binding protein H-NS